MRDFRDLVIEDSAQDYALLEESYVRALAQAATYRQLTLVALDQLCEAHNAVAALQERLRQVMGLTHWHRDERPSE